MLFICHLDTQEVSAPNLLYYASKNHGQIWINHCALPHVLKLSPPSILALKEKEHNRRPQEHILECLVRFEVYIVLVVVVGSVDYLFLTFYTQYHMQTVSTHWFGENSNQNMDFVVGDVLDAMWLDLIGVWVKTMTQMQLYEIYV